MADHLDMAGLLEDYLTTKITDCEIVQVLDLDFVDQMSIRDKRILISYGGEIVSPGLSETPSAALVKQQWFTVVGIVSAGRAIDGPRVYDAAGEMMTDIAGFLQGYKFSGYSALNRVTAPAPKYVAGCYYIPMLWEANLLSKAA